jgi:hypothetical protein
MQFALSGGPPEGCEPLDWLDNTTPELWPMGNERVTYHWAEPMACVRSIYVFAVKVRSGGSIN